MLRYLLTIDKIEIQPSHLFPIDDLPAFLRLQIPRQSVGAVLQGTRLPQILNFYYIAAASSSRFGLVWCNAQRMQMLRPRSSLLRKASGAIFQEI